MHNNKTNRVSNSVSNPLSANWSNVGYRSDRLDRYDAPRPTRLFSINVERTVRTRVESQPRRLCFETTRRTRIDTPYRPVYTRPARRAGFTQKMLLDQWRKSAVTSRNVDELRADAPSLPIYLPIFFLKKSPVPPSAESTEAVAPLAWVPYTVFQIRACPMADKNRSNYSPFQAVTGGIRSSRRRSHRLRLVRKWTVFQLRAYRKHIVYAFRLTSCV